MQLDSTLCLNIGKKKGSGMHIFPSPSLFPGATHSQIDLSDNETRKKEGVGEKKKH